MLVQLPNMSICQGGGGGGGGAAGGGGVGGGGGGGQRARVLIGIDRNIASR